MTYAYSPNPPTIIKRHRTLPDEHWVADTADTGHFETLTVGNAATYGYYPIDYETATQPADTPTTTWDRSLPFVVDTFVVTWTERDKTQAELDADTVKSEQEAALAQVADIEFYLAIPDPSAAQVEEVVSRLAAICRRLLLDTYGA